MTGAGAPDDLFDTTDLDLGCAGVDVAAPGVLRADLAGLKRHEFRRRYLAGRPTTWFVYPTVEYAGFIAQELAEILGAFHPPQGSTPTVLALEAGGYGCSCPTATTSSTATRVVPLVGDQAVPLPARRARPLRPDNPTVPARRPHPPLTAARARQREVSLDGEKSGGLLGELADSWPSPVGGEVADAAGRVDSADEGVDGAGCQGDGVVDLGPILAQVSGGQQDVAQRALAGTASWDFAGATQCAGADKPVPQSSSPR